MQWHLLSVVTGFLVIGCGHCTPFTKKSHTSSNEIAHYHKHNHRPNKLSISDLRPCISKAFCEVNSITQEPTYETGKEFYDILKRLKKLIDDTPPPPTKDLATSSSNEDYSSSEESYEQVPHNNGPQRYGYYRGGRSLSDFDGKLERKKKAKNTTETLVQSEQRAFVQRKALELNVVDDLAALIKISAEIGQALRSPRRCRSLFKKCRMNYEQIIRIFNRTQQAVEVADTTPEPFLVVEPTATSATPDDGVADPDPTPPPEEEDAINRNKKSRTDFSDDEESDYGEAENNNNAPVKTYSLFSQSDPPQSNNNKRPDDEAFHKFEKVFPKGEKPVQHKKDTISSKLRPVVASSDESNESIARSAEDVATDSEEIEMDVPPKKQKTKRPEAIDADTENDSDAEILSSEINKKSSSEEEENNADKQIDLIYTRDDDKSNGFNTFGFYPQVRPSYTSHSSIKSKGKRRKGNKKGDKNEQQTENSSEEVQSDYGLKVKSKRKRESGEYYSQQYSKGQQYGQQQQALEEQQQQQQRPGYYGSGSGSEIQSDDNQNAQPSGLFQSIMGWFSRGKSSVFGGGGGNNDQVGGYSSGQYSQYDQQQQPNQRPYYNRHQYSNEEIQFDDHRPPRKNRQKQGKETDPDPPRRPHHHNHRQPAQQGRTDSSSEEEEEEIPQIKRKTNKKPTHQTKQPSSNYPFPSNTLTASGPPPPLVIDPGQGQEGDTNMQKTLTQQKPQQKNSAETETLETSSEEEQIRPQKKKQEKVFTGIFSSAAEIDRQIPKPHSKEDDEVKDPNLLLKTFDSVANTFTTSADKIRDWSEEEMNSGKKVRFGGGVSTRGRYTIKKKKRNFKGDGFRKGQQQVKEVEEDIEESNKGSSEEEEEEE